MQGPQEVITSHKYISHAIIINIIDLPAELSGAHHLLTSHIERRGRWSNLSSNDSALSILYHSIILSSC